MRHTEAIEEESEGTNDFFLPSTILVLACVEERDLGSVKAGNRDRLNGERLARNCPEEIPTSYQLQSTGEITGLGKCDLPRS